MEFQCFTSMSCVFDTSKSWTVSASYSHYASSSGLLIRHTIWRHASFIETIHPPSTPCFNTHINFAIKTNWSRLCLDFKRVNRLCYNKLFFFLRSRFLFSFQELTLSYKPSWLLFQGRLVPFKLFADCGLWLNSSDYFRTFIWKVLF